MLNFITLYSITDSVGKKNIKMSTAVFMKIKLLFTSLANLFLFALFEK